MRAVTRHSITLYAGMPKAGSQSVQRWLARNADRLRRDHGITVVVAPPGRDLEFVPYVDFDGRPDPDAHAEAVASSVNSGWVVGEMLRSPDALERFVEALAACADAHERIVVSGEPYALLFATCEQAGIAARLGELAARYGLAVAYYARPQHTSLEAAWRQWGFRSGRQPSSFLQHYAEHLHYLRTARWMGEVAPCVDFELRRYGPEWLASGNVTVDFARTFLGLEGVGDDEEWTNRGLPLTVVNLLRDSPDGMFWSDIDDNSLLLRVKEVVNGCRVDDARAEWSRMVLRGYAFERFGRENAELGWAGFVPPPDVEVPGVGALDELWSPQASAGERAAFLGALGAAIGRPYPRR